MSDKINIAINIIEGKLDLADSRAIREVVFVIEQQVPPEIEYDEFEESSTHIIARVDKNAVGTARWRKTKKGFKLERFAVNLDFRGKGIGNAMVLFILNQLKADDYISLNSQVSAIGFYAGIGFQAEGEIFYEADIPHRKMIYKPKL